MRQLKRDGGDPVQLVLLALGQQSAITARRLFGPSRVWVSATPFIASRHAKARGRRRDPRELLGFANQRAFARQVLIEELGHLRARRPEIPEPLSIEPLNLEHRCGAHLLRPIQFKRFRQKQGDDGGRRAAGAFRIVFREEVVGPICLGHSSHFGLGMFVPEGSR
jgi:CRISPR-associated protein Csb2